MAKFVEDRFDRLPDDLKRIGAHRGPRRKGRGWIGFAWAVLATGILVFGGLFGVSRFLGVDLGISLFATPPTATPTPTPTPTVPAVTDPATIDQAARGIKIDVLNGTTTPGLQSTVGDSLAALGWNIGGRLPASTSDIETTFVYYGDPLNEDVARGLVLAIGLGEIRLVDPTTFPGASLTIVLGADAGPPPLVEPGTTPEATPAG